MNTLRIVYVYHTDMHVHYYDTRYDPSLINYLIPYSWKYWWELEVGAKITKSADLNVAVQYGIGVGTVYASRKF